MKTLQEIKDEYAQEHDYSDWNEMMCYETSIEGEWLDEIANRYAKYAEEQVSYWGARCHVAEREVEALKDKLYCNSPVKK